MMACGANLRGMSREELEEIAAGGSDAECEVAMAAQLLASMDMDSGRANRPEAQYRTAPESGRMQSGHPQ